MGFTVHYWIDQSLYARQCVCVDVRLGGTCPVTLSLRDVSFGPDDQDRCKSIRTSATEADLAGPKKCVYGQCCLLIYSFGCRINTLFTEWTPRMRFVDSQVTYWDLTLVEHVVTICSAHVAC